MIIFNYDIQMQNIEKLIIKKIPKYNLEKKKKSDTYGRPKKP